MVFFVFFCKVWMLDLTRTISAMTERKSNGSVCTTHHDSKFTHAFSAHTFIQIGWGLRAWTAAFEIFALNHCHRVCTRSLFAYFLICNLIPMFGFTFSSVNKLLWFYTHSTLTCSISNHSQHSQSIGVFFFFAFFRVLVRCVWSFWAAETPIWSLLFYYFSRFMFDRERVCVCVFFKFFQLVFICWLKSLSASRTTHYRRILLTLQFLVRD